MDDLERMKDEVERLTGLPRSTIQVDRRRSDRRKLTVVITCDSESQRSAAYRKISDSGQSMKHVGDVDVEVVEQENFGLTPYFKQICVLRDGRVFGIDRDNLASVMERQLMRNGTSQWRNTAILVPHGNTTRVQDGSTGTSKFGDVGCMTTYRHNGEWHVLLWDDEVNRFRDIDMAGADQMVRSFPGYPELDRRQAMLRPTAMMMHIDGVLYGCFESTAGGGRKGTGKEYTIRRCPGFDDQRDVPLAVPAAEDQPFTPEQRLPSPARLPAHARLAGRRLDYGRDSSSSSSDDEEAEQSYQGKGKKRAVVRPDKRRLSGGQDGGRAKKNKWMLSSKKRPCSPVGSTQDGKRRASAGSSSRAAAAAAAPQWVDIEAAAHWDTEWKVQLDAEVQCMTALDDERILFTTSDSRLHILDVVNHTISTMPKALRPRMYDGPSTIFWQPALSKWMFATEDEWMTLLPDFTKPRTLETGLAATNTLMHPDGRTLVSLEHNYFRAYEIMFPLQYDTTALPVLATTELATGMGSLALRI